MNSILAILHDPSVQTVGLTIIGVLLAKLLYPFLEKLVKKTPTLTDDEFLTTIEGIVNDALANAAVKVKAEIVAPPATPIPTPEV